jgi:hypothetical protein
VKSVDTKCDRKRLGEGGHERFPFIRWANTLLLIVLIEYRIASVKLPPVASIAMANEFWDLMLPQECSSPTMFST